MRRANERIAAQVGHSTLETPLGRQHGGAISSTPENGHFFVDTAGTCAPTGSRWAARSIRERVWGLLAVSRDTRPSEAPGASRRGLAPLPGSVVGLASTCCSSCSLWALARSTLCSPVRASISIRTCNGLQSKRVRTAITAFAGPHSLHLATPPGQDSLQLRLQSSTRACNP